MRAMRTVMPRSWANTRHETQYGTAALSWLLTGNGMTAEVTVPNGCRGVVELPGCRPLDLAPGTHRIESTRLDHDTDPRSSFTSVTTT